MSLPVLAKVWQFDINRTVTAQGSVALTEKALLRSLKDALVGFAQNPWVVQSSCDGAGGAGSFGNSDLVDRWTTDTDIVKAAAGSNHSWIVLRQLGIAANYEVCIDCNQAAQSLSIIVSPSAGFGTGVIGTATTRPTASDEIVVLNVGQWFSQSDSQHIIQAMQSTDGECTRLQIWRNGNIQCTFGLFDKPLNPVAGWTNPSVAYFVGSSATVTTVALLQAIAALFRGRGVTGTTLVITATGEAGVAGQLSQLAGIGTAASDYDGAWPLFPVGLYSITLANKGRLGTLADLWWKPISVADADTFPNNAATREFAAFAALVFPWTGGADIPLLG